MSFYEDILNGLTQPPPSSRPMMGSLAVPMRAGAQPAATAPAQPSPAVPESSGFDDLSTFLAGMGEGGGALLPALGSGMRAVSSEKERRGRLNDTYGVLVKNGIDPAEAKAMIGNPELLKMGLSRIYAPKTQAVAPGNVIVDNAGKIVFDNRETTKPTNDIVEYEYAKKQGYGGNLQDFLQMKQSQAVGQQSPQQRADLAKQYGLDPNSDAGRSFILTGKLPREDQQALTATDKKAILEADDMALNSQAAIDGLTRAIELSKKAYDGATANERGWITSQFGSEAGNATRELNQAVTQTALQQLKAIFGGAPTEGERKILLDIQGSAEQPQAVRERILNEAMRLAQVRLQFYKDRAGELRGGQFYKPQSEGTQQPAPSGVGGAPIRAKNAAGDVIEFNGKEWVPVQ